MNIVAIIPERMASARYPGKPMVKILGIPMVAHIYARAKLAKGVEEVYVASPDQEILDYIGSHGGKGGLEPTPPVNAPTTIKMALPEIEKDFGKGIDWIIMIQGDEPMIEPETIDELAEYVRSRSEAKAVNVVVDIKEEKEYFDPNIVKIVLNQKNEGIWFFRTPSDRWKESLKTLPIKKQTGIVAFRKDFLMNFGVGDKRPFEKIESVDMFRMIEEGETVPTVLSKSMLYSVDVPSDRDLVEDLMKTDSFVELYAAEYKD